MNTQQGEFPSDNCPDKACKDYLTNHDLSPMVRSDHILV